MADPPSPSSSPGIPRNLPTATLRRRGLPARTTLESIPDWPERRNSTLSDSLSEARNSIRSSTDGIFLPRVGRNDEDPVATEESHWHSAPLALALLPAIAGILVKDGSAVVTDVTLLALAGIFLNWSVRLPWDWYRSAQATHPEQLSGYDTTNGPAETDGEADAAVESGDETRPRSQPSRTPHDAAIKELQMHEVAALASCFVFPLIGTWILHVIRHSLSRPSEGLVSNYNLTIFLLASEIRPFAHLLKLVQARTLHLQRVVASNPDEDRLNTSKIEDISKRLEELETHIAEAAATRLAKSPSKSDPTSPHEQTDTSTLITQAVAEARKALQPEIEALNRAVRHYEKRTALTTLQSDTRFQQLESQSRDAIALAAAAQRSSLSRRSSYAFILADWLCACIVIPAQLALSILNLPNRVATRCLNSARRMLGFSVQNTQTRSAVQPGSKSSRAKMAQRSSSKFRAQSPPDSRTSSSQQQQQSLTAARGVATR
ncbi:hypothetical protein N7493_008400 [Penicillium malachiteum]|uniref:Uncharacterized protein n=1 Tax=Penicillium malachiteum TaxID=1324776 RepID=A0AAD6HHR7_9EURO|nr:hypothetical protein N7493_008400 [Penicillium malachiteum]